MDITSPHDQGGHAEDVQLWRSEALGGLDLIHGRFAHFSFTPHAHEEFFIAVTESGSAAPRFWGGTQHVGRGDLFVLSPGVVHSGGPAGDSVWRYRAFYPPPGLMERVAAELTGSARGTVTFAQDMIDDPASAALLLEAHAGLERPEPSALARETRLLEALAALAIRHAAAPLPISRIGQEHRAVRRARQLLDALPAENVSLDALAHEAGLSAFRLCRVFRRETGLSPHAYQVLVRARLAKSLLAQGISISQAAAEAGFFDQAHLTRHFKRIYGVTPGSYAGGLPSWR